MQEKNKACILLGYSGHAFVVVEAYILAGGTLDGYADVHKRTLNPFHLNYLGTEGEESFAYWENGNSFILGIGDNLLRTKVASLVRQKGCECASVFHPASSVSTSASIGFGSFIARNVAVNPLCNIGKDVILNTSCSIDHECTIMDGTHIAPGAVLAGNVVVGKRSFVGANSVVKQGVSIGDDVVVGAGTVVLKNIPSGAQVVGNPARIIKTSGV